jgi:sugar/nucleoside kinase (ribokinase family)
MAPEHARRDLDVVVIGNAGVDTNVFLSRPEIDFGVEANFTENLDCVGQAGAYAARSYAALGFRTAFIGHVGDDWAGRMVREAFAHDGIDTDLLGLDPAGTARSVNLIYPDGRRKNFYDGKGHLALAVDLVACQALMARARLVHVHLANWTRTLLPIARNLGVTIACDLQDVVDPEDAYRADHVRQADILFASSVNHPDPAPLIRTLLAAGRARLVVCGMGAEGCALGARKHPPVPGALAARTGGGYQWRRRQPGGRVPLQPPAAGPAPGGIHPPRAAGGPARLRPAGHVVEPDHGPPAGSTLFALPGAPMTCRIEAQ